MTRRYPQLAFGSDTIALQQRLGVRHKVAAMEAMAVDDVNLGTRERAFIQARDGFYMGTVGESGWPYVQFRGGVTGFLRVLDERTLAFADFRGNRQYISAGNLAHDERVSLFLMDYAGRQRLKLLARAEVHDADERPDLLSRVEDPDYRARVERIVLLRIEAFDWNCPQHITPRFTEAEFQERLDAAHDGG